MKIAKDMKHCKECKINLEGQVRIQNDKEGYVKCLNHGLGVIKRSEAK